MKRTLEDSAWPETRLGEALQVLARKSGLVQDGPESPAIPESARHQRGRALDIWINMAAAGMGLESENIMLSYAESLGLLRSLGPALIRLPDGSFLILLPGCLAVGPDYATRRLQPDDIKEALFGSVEVPLSAEADQLLQDAGLPLRKRAAARAAILNDLLRDARTGQCWALRISPGAGFLRLLRQAKVPHRLLLLALAHLLEYSLWILAWYVAGRGALEGRLEAAWMVAWVLLLLTLVPLRAAGVWLRGKLAISGGGLLKERLLYGTLRLEPEEIRCEGAGRLLGRVIESQALESLALGGGFLALFAALELVLAAIVLAAGAGGGWHAVLLLGWTGLTLALGIRYFASSRRWTGERLEMTQDLVERMVGHRTRLAQEAPLRWHQVEDGALERYLGASTAMDKTSCLITALIPRGWLIIGMLGLLPVFVSGRASSATLAVSIGGSLLAFQAYHKLAAGLWQLTGASLAWEQVSPLFRAASRPKTQGSPASLSASPERVGDGQTLLDARDLVFRYSSHSEPVLRQCSLNIAGGDRLVLEGPSGGGKSTLASVLSGLRTPNAGLLLVGGFDRNSLGTQGWRRVVATAPQFHENHLLTGTLAFNLLMGRSAVPGPEDMAEAEDVCRELGLGGLLDRMPAGLLQLVGETGWQISHGERSRIYIARALLQDAELVVLDESFAALDPENLRLVLDCVDRRAGAVLAIAHR